MCGSALLLALAFQVGPFYEQRPGFAALRPFWSREAETTDVLWPVYEDETDFPFASGGRRSRVRRFGWGLVRWRSSDG